jgi:hypothetical protein
MSLKMNQEISSAEKVSRDKALCGMDLPRASRRRWFQLGLAALSGVVVVGELAFGQISSRLNNPTSKPDRRRSIPVSTKANTQAQDTSTNPEATKKKTTANKSEDTTRWREGHRIENVTATIEVSETERFTASIDSERNLIILENLSLERIAEAMKIDSSDNRWTVHGRVTEFKGQNYLWLERATRAAKISTQ